jgi:tRNA (guanine-N7-)-methyltransferase
MSAVLSSHLIPMSEDTPNNGPARTMLYDPTEHRIRSFVTRAGRLSTGQARAFEEFGGQFLVEYKKEMLDYAAAFGRQAPTILEIGFGMGDTTAHIARQMPDKNFIGVEVHTPGVGSLLKQIGEQGITNLRLIQHDAFEVLHHMIADGSLDGVHIYFPDPWHKARHNKRRLIQPPFVKLLCDKLAPGGYIHLATDWEDYAVQMLEVLSAEPQLANTAEGYAPQPAYRPLTKFENRGLKLGHGVWDLVFTKK